MLPGRYQINKHYKRIVAVNLFRMTFKKMRFYIHFFFCNFRCLRSPIVNSFYLFLFCLKNCILKTLSGLPGISRKLPKIIRNSQIQNSDSFNSFNSNSFYLIVIHSNRFLPYFKDDYYYIFYFL